MYHLKDCVYFGTLACSNGKGATEESVDYAQIASNDQHEVSLKDDSLLLTYL